MYKKLLIASSIFIMAIFSFSICFANNGLQDAAQDVRNLVGNAENAVEGAAKDISNASKDATGKMEEGANNVGNTVMNNLDNNMEHNTKTGTMNNDYNATRTATTDTTFMGMNATTWTWLIVGIVAIAIIGLIWYYTMQVRSSNYNDKD